MTYAFLIVVSVAITVKLLFLSFSLYFTLKNSKSEGIPTNMQTKSSNKSLFISWKQIPRIFMPRSLYCPNTNNKDFQNKS